MWREKSIRKCIRITSKGADWAANKKVRKKMKGSTKGEAHLVMIHLEEGDYFSFA